MRIGESMYAALRYLEANDGAVTCAFELARAVGQRGSAQYGYQIVNRCMGAGLVACDPQHPKAAKGSAGAMVLTDAGREALSSNGGEQS